MTGRETETDGEGCWESVRPQQGVCSTRGPGSAGPVRRGCTGLAGCGLDSHGSAARLGYESPLKRGYPRGDVPLTVGVLVLGESVSEHTQLLRPITSSVRISV